MKKLIGFIKWIHKKNNRLIYAPIIAILSNIGLYYYNPLWELFLLLVLGFVILCGGVLVITVIIFGEYENQYYWYNEDRKDIFNILKK